MTDCASWCCGDHDDLPDRLRRSQWAPQHLDVAARTHRRHILHGATLAVVGPRDAGQATVDATTRIAGSLAAEGYVIVSGLAAGVDAAAHRAAVNVDGDTIAVLGHGLKHRPYPASNVGLAKHLMWTQAVVSQFHEKAGPNRRSFAIRNGVIAGLSKATIVMDATDQAGSLITVWRSLADGRPVYVPRPVAAMRPWVREAQETHGDLVRLFNNAGEIVDDLTRTAIKT